MKQLTKLTMVAIMGLIMVGCASTGDVDELHAHVDSDMKVLHDHVDSDMAAMAAEQAKLASEQAKLAAEHADINTKLDNMFKKSMTK
jgi:murein lipoprotein